MKTGQIADWKLTLIIYLLVAIGIIMVSSASNIWAQYRFADALYFGKRQFLFATIGLIAMYIVSKIPYHTWRTYSKRSEEHTSELQSRGHLVCRLLLEKKKQATSTTAGASRTQ